jgi:antitoxin (DNA-binding transcriptional repressor) of toxin-antitoxin stability system
MKTITIRKLHQETRRWIKRASEREVYVTERGRLVAKIVAVSPLPAKPFFANPRFARAFLAQRKYLRGGGDSTRTISEERNHEVTRCECCLSLGIGDCRERKSSVGYRR